MKKIYNFCRNDKNEKFPIFSYGNDYNIIKENLKLNSINKKSRYYKWEKCFYDIRPFLIYLSIHQNTVVEQYTKHST